MRERTCRFGPARELAGIITEPRQTPATPLPTVLLFNAGLLHHIGQNRLNVTLARRLADRGFTGLRFDFSGLGDSLPRPAARGKLFDRHVEETRLAMDFMLATKQAKEFVLIGLCTGADNAHRTAVADERARGIVVIDGYAYPTARSMMQRYARRFPNWLRRRLRMERQEAEEAQTEQELLYYWELPDKNQLADEIRRLIDRNVARLALFSGNNHAYSHDGQFAESFSDIDFRGTIEEHRFPESDHTYSIVGDRVALVDHIVSWVDRHYARF